ncbi:Chemotaxis response regulator protein-glutamate methylesterase [Hydrogenovibrio crunogenus]|uniref:Protein-glutamate methylesterase/protein-glutamine glutaminase n=1 Tax=Hydrogenovibrio crunogenus TaxID=39765 RepID=A0A4P7NYR5_9GAMM|nr:chemotaxis response regulator protein-glutamate methylesterase [Hydrogenovibrio crunogenus]QBZ82719.1 Chemotaxis response regulator protein-glutamate methylesterase [Hydrogenovibrio crunogenus]RUM90329.1 MAG: chemotaxis response regulator protein-glutamate methylesterase [Thiomicrospira sp.]
MSKVKVLIVDDSALVRQMLQEMLKSDPEIEVVGTASDPYDAREKVKQLHPDVLTLDVEMPRMDGVTFLKNLMRLHPLPVVMISTLTEKGADITFEALDLGAVDFVAKPKIDLQHTFEDYTDEICRKVKTASKVSKWQLERQYARYVANKESKPKVLSKPGSLVSKVVEKFTTDAIVPKKAPSDFSKPSHKVIALGASTGGTEAIKEVLMRLPSTTPAIVITQHIPASFSLPFAQRMNSISEMEVTQAEDRQPILAGHVYIAPGDKHLLVERTSSGYICRLNDGPPVNRHKPSVDVMFRTVVQSVGKNAVGVLLTGMGADGAKGMKELQEIGVPTIAQDEKTCVVWGMPGEAVKLGAADYVLPLGSIPEKILSLIKK